MKYPLIFSFFKSKFIIFLLCLICLSEIGYAIAANYLTYWSKDFFDALQQKHMTSLSAYIYKFTYLCAISYFFYVLSEYIEKSIAIKWRADIVNKFSANWLNSWHFIYPKITTTNQRITEDSIQVSEVLLSLFRAGMRSVFVLIAFLHPLWEISSKLESIPGLLIWIALVMALFGSVGFQYMFINPLKKLQQVKEETNGVLRAHLAYIGLHAEQIMFLKGEKAEKNAIDNKLTPTYIAAKKFVNKYISLQYVQQVFIKINAILATFLLAPFYLKDLISFGVLSQANVIFFYISDAFAFLPRYSQQLALFYASLGRLQQLEDSLMDQRVKNIKTDGDILVANNITITNNGKQLIKNISFELNANDHILLEGKSGVGKTTLLRVIAGIWKEHTGSVTYPSGNILINTTVVYLPLMKAYESIAYPLLQIDSERIKNALDIVELNIDENTDLRSLSSGQKQRLALARVIYNQPECAFLDEPTSSLPLHTAFHLLHKIYKTLPNTAFFTISHQSELESLHEKIIKV